MSTRRDVIIGATATAASLSLAGAEAAVIMKPPVMTSPIFRESDLMLSVFYNNETKGMGVTLRKPEAYYQPVHVNSIVDAENYYFRRIDAMGVEERLQSKHDFFICLTRSANIIAGCTRRACGNSVFGNLKVLEAIGYMKSGDTVGRWHRCSPTAVALALNPNHDLHSFYGTDDELPFGSNLLVAYIGASERPGYSAIADGPGVIQRDDQGGYNLYLQGSTTTIGNDKDYARLIMV